MTNARNAAKIASPEREDIAIGHDILGLISSAMYTEPLTVYRELCQNAADSIDEAVSCRLLASGQGRVDILIDQMRRKITVRDNGVGVTNESFTARMCSIGASRKRGTRARGFRGIGRLVGLGYCQELVFRSRSAGDTRVCEASWDCRALRDALGSPLYSSLVDVVESVVKISSRRAEVDDAPHFFEVELRKVVRLASDALLNVAAVDAYLAEVGPVPFHPSFSGGIAIADYLRGNGGYSTLAVHINGRDEAITRPYRDAAQLSASKAAALQAPTFFEVPSQDGERAAVGWISHHEYLGAFPRRLGIRGLRARVGNLQIGEDHCFDAAFSEPRFNQWAIGEVHVLDERIVTNGRRDFFEPNLHFENLCNHLVGYGHDIARRCRSLSNARRKERGLTDLENALTIYAKLLKRSRVARILRDELVEDVLEQIDRSRRKLSLKDQGRDQLHRVEQRLNALAQGGKVGDVRATQRQMGQADVLRLLRERIPGGTAASVQLLKMLDELS
jgi:molecular chaperone HtpG